MATLEAACIAAFTSQLSHPPDAVREALDDWNLRHDVYRVWRQHFSRCMQGPEDVCRSMLRWVCAMYPRYPMVESFERFRLFKTIADWLLSNRCPRGCQADCEAALSLQPLEDVLRVSVAEGQALGQWLESKTAFTIPQAEDQAELLRLPYRPPEDAFDNFVRKAVSSTVTRSEAYVVLTDTLATLVMCVDGYAKSNTAVLNKAQWILDLLIAYVEQYPPNPLVLPALHECVSRASKLSNFDATDGNADIALSRSVENSLLRLIASLPDAARHSDYVAQPFEYHIPMPPPATYMRLVAAKAAAAEEIGGYDDNLSSRVASSSKKNRYSLLSWVDTDDFLLSIGGVGAATANATDDKAAKRGILRAGRTSLAYTPSGSVAAEIDIPLPKGTCLEDIMSVTQSVWLQIDPKPDRILLSARDAVPPSRELLVSPVAGALFFTIESLQWMGPSVRPVMLDPTQSPTAQANGKPLTGLANQSSYDRQNEPGLVVEYSRISHFSFGRLFDDERKIDEDYDGDGTGVSSRPVSARKAQRTKSPVPEGKSLPGMVDDEPSGKVTVTFDESGKLMENDSDLYYIVVHETETFKFFPFFENEAQQIVALLSEATGMPPYVDRMFVREVLANRVDKVRTNLLKQLEAQENPWIERTTDLDRLISSLIVENKPQSMLDMERLYHSCRLEREVTKEAIHILRRSWLETNSEKVRLKIISVLDRLLDRAVIHPREPSFLRLMEWLRYAEKNLDPYKSAESLKNIVALIQRAEDIKKQRLVPLNQTELPTMFDYWEQYKAYRKGSERAIYRK